MTVILETIIASVVDGNHTQIEAQVQTALDEGIEPTKIIDEALILAMDVVGKKFAKSEIYVPEMLVSALTMKKGLAKIKPLLKGGDIQSKATILMGTVKGDLHDIGKNLVIMMMEGAGFKVVDLGVDLKVEDVVKRIKEEAADILGLSALLTTTMPEMKKVIDTLTEAGLRDKVKVIVGGAPLDEKFANSIGADGYGRDAAEAVQLVKQLVN